MMTSEGLIDPHIHLYSYWLSKRNGRILPARRDIDPGELAWLLPFLFIVDKPAGEFQYRLMGTGVAQDLGRDLTGKPLSTYVVNSPEMIAAVQALGERVFADTQPVFGTCHHATGNGAIHNTSALLLPLSDDGRRVNMFIATRAACFNSDVRASRNWLVGACLKQRDVIDIHHAEDLEKRCRDWKNFCLANGQPQICSRPNRW